MHKGSWRFLWDIAHLGVTCGLHRMVEIGESLGGIVLELQDILPTISPIYEVLGQLSLYVSIVTGFLVATMLAHPAPCQALCPSP